MADVQAIIDAGVARSSSAQPHMLTVDAPELVRIVSQTLARFYFFASRRRSTNFGARATATFTAGSPGGWPFPTGALSILRVEIASTGEEVAVTRLDDRDGMAPMPSVFEFGRTLVPCGNANDPTTDDLVIWYSASPTTLTQTADPLPAVWPEAFNPLLELAVAKHLAKKEGRLDDLATFSAEESEWQAYFDAWLTDASLAPGDRFAGLRPAQVSAASDDGG